ncbi:hypothetical protein B0H63DRAFT_515401 [Podospora didyma]|uniref:CPAF-like PDZ domain-containing protein n=1 Tax=Podospora didyma TaxID=330526 RepID=A0AAE0K0T4_9PEZI|nr:hypothetical protein B0H63DRAFT_515401 [Podospora didyma]
MLPAVQILAVALALSQLSDGLPASDKIATTESHSTLDYLKNPSRGYLSESVDLIRGLDDIAANLKNSSVYSNKFAFLADLYTLTGIRVRDAHFSYTSLLFDLFTFRIGVKFISISDEGLSLHRIVLHDDTNHTQLGYVPSPVSTINGIPALEYLQKISPHSGGSHDPDTRFNMLFPSVVKESAYTQSDRNFATTFPGYPKPVNVTLAGSTAGFIPSFSDDVAVLAVNSFVEVVNPKNLAPILDTTLHIHNVTVDFLSHAKQTGRTKLILDLQSNGGGLLPNLAALYLTLFPAETQLHLLWKVRAYPQLEWLGKELMPTKNQTTTASYSLPSALKPFTQPNYTAWPSFPPFYGPVPEGAKWGSYTHPSLLNPLTRIHIPGLSHLALPASGHHPPLGRTVRLRMRAVRIHPHARARDPHCSHGRPAARVAADASRRTGQREAGDFLWDVSFG